MGRKIVAVREVEDKWVTGGGKRLGQLDVESIVTDTNDGKGTTAGIIIDRINVRNPKTGYKETVRVILVAQYPGKTPWETFSGRHRQAILGFYALAGGAAGSLFVYTVYTMLNNR